MICGRCGHSDAQHRPGLGCVAQYGDGDGCDCETFIPDVLEPRCADCGQVGSLEPAPGQLGDPAADVCLACADKRRAILAVEPDFEADNAGDVMEFTESRRGYIARERWARRYDDLNGAPESESDR